MELSPDNFSIRSKDPLIFRKDCKKCVCKRAKEYRDKNHEKVLKSKRAYYIFNKEKVLEYAKEYREREDVANNRKSYMEQHRKTQGYKEKHSDRNKKYCSKAKVKKRNAERSKERYHSNLEESRKKAREYMKLDHVRERVREYYHKTKTPKNRIRNSLNSSINTYLKKRGSSKGRNSILKHLPYTIDELRDHIESQFEDWMTWDNWGVYRTNTWDDNDKSTWTWHIDHIIRHKTFNYDSMDHPDFKKCWSLDNLRPLSAKENVIRQ